MKSLFSYFRAYPDFISPIINALFFGAALLVSENGTGKSDLPFTFAIFTFLNTLLYFFTRLIPIYFKKDKSQLKVSLHSSFVIWVTTAFISCFTLNRSMNVFDESVFWYSIFLVLFTIAFVLRAIYHDIETSIRFVLDIFLGAGTLLMLYLVITLSSWYIIGVFGFFLLGFSLHVFVPLYILIYSIRTAIAKFKEKAFRNAYLIGLGMAIVPVIYFCVQWKITVDEINTVHELTLFNDQEEELPAKIELAQKFPTDGVAAKILKSGIVYNTFEKFDIFSMDFTSFNFNEPKQHDPLVAIANNLIGDAHINIEQRIEILNFLFRGRHFSESKFWRDDKINTSKITYQTQLFPEYRLAYTELLMQMKLDENTKHNMFLQQEALYTFYLPEGTAVTSLSLWVDGKEQESVLTTKSKADSAYSDIVGVQFRDPSVVHWKEGNTITVRVFPVTYNNPRQIRIGFTSPLQKVGNKLRYKNIPFQGPDASNAEWDILVSQIGKTVPVTSSLNLKTLENGYQYTETPDENWYIETDIPALNQQVFRFGGFNYVMQEMQQKNDVFKYDSVILDINNAWSREEVDHILNEVDRSLVLCWDGQKFVGGDEPKFNSLVAQKLYDNFSVLPFYKITNPEKKLVVSKGNITGPFLDELKKSTFAENTKTFFKEGHRPHVFALGGESSVYIKTLAELRLFHYATGDNEQLTTCLKGNFPMNLENDSTVFIPSSNVSISKIATADTLPTKAPDHIMRLFAYNKIMALIGASYFDESYELEQPVELASKAHVVSPVSSLIVLETQEDYEKFGIENDKDGLGNATTKNAGAVPEPHEWALIVLTILGLGYYFIRKRRLA